MAHFTFRLLLPVVAVLVMLAVMAEATPPGIANNPSHATCKNEKYKECYNLVHVCPKFCPDQCYVECASCKPMCGVAPPEEDPTPPTTPTSPSETYKSPPPPVVVTPSPPPTPVPTDPPHSPPLPSPTPVPPPTTSSPPPPVTPTPPPATTPTNHNPPSTPPTHSYPPPNPNPPSTNPNPPSSPPVNPNNPPSSPPTNPNPPSSPPMIPNNPPSSPPVNPNNPPSSPPPVNPNPPAVPSAPNSPPSSSTSAGGKRVRCKNVNYPQCYNMFHTCPSACPNGCEVDCVTCKAVCHCDRPGAVCQDPRFIGGDGITFYFHGEKDKNFCLVSDPNLHINAHFIGKRNPALKRDFTWVQALGILFHTHHRLLIAAQKTAVWDDSVERLTMALDGRPITTLSESEGSRWQYPAENATIFIVRMARANHVAIEVKGLFRIMVKVVPITKEDSRIHNYGVTEGDTLAHLDVGFKFFGLSDEVSGVLGQTYGAEYVSHVNVKAAMAIFGNEEEFETSSLFAPDCVVARFRGGDDDGNHEVA